MPSTTPPAPSAAHALPRPLGAFDGQEPPDWEGILDCVHCGICLPQCPTYRVLGQEMDSPRGRVYLMRAAAEGRIGLTENFVLHMDRCLGCRACETACPAGVPFGRLMEETRGQIERKVPRTLGRRLMGELLLGVFPERQRLARVLALTRLYQRSGLQRLVRGSGLLERFPRVQAMERLLPALPAGTASRLPAETLPPSGPQRGTVALLEGCVQALLFPGVNRATVSLLARAGYRVIVPDGQGLLRRASSPLGRPGRGARAGPPERGRLRRRRLDRDERGGLRRGAPRLRAPPRRRPARVHAGGAGAGRHRAARRAPAGSEAAARPHGDLPRALPPRARTARARGSAGHPARHPGAPARRALRVRLLLRVGRRLQPHGARDRRDSSSTGSSTGSRRPAPGSSPAATRAASSSSAAGSRTAASRVRAYHPVELLAWSVEGTVPADGA